MSATERFIEELGLLFQEQGQPRIAGRVLGLLVVEGHELSLQQISERLSVSRASVSTNARMLVKSGTIRLTAHAGDRQDFYEVNKAPYADMVAEMAERTMKQAARLRAFVEPIGAENKAASGRVDDLAQALEQASTLLTDWAAANQNDQKIRKDQK